MSEEKITWNHLPNEDEKNKFDLYKTAYEIAKKYYVDPENSFIEYQAASCEMQYRIPRIWIGIHCLKGERDKVKSVIAREKYDDKKINSAMKFAQKFLDYWKY